MKRAVLFDLGNTLAEYYESCAYQELLPSCIEEAGEFLKSRGLSRRPAQDLWRAAEGENWERDDHGVRALEGRLLRIFRPDRPVLPEDVVTGLCRAFMKPIFALGQCYEDSLPTIRELRKRGLTVAIVSNAQWGCPAALCQEEAQRLGLTQQVEAVVFCADVGWRKPARAIFDFTTEELGLERANCLFVGDHPEWDLAGPQAARMDAMLLDRKGSRPVPVGEPVLGSLAELWSWL